MNTQRILTLLSAVGLSLASSAPGQNLLINGSFESPVLPPGADVRLPVGVPSLPGWEVGGTGEMRLLSQAWLYPPKLANDGAQFVTFNGADQPVGQTISQTFETVTGRWYTVRFSVGRGGGETNGVVGLRAEVTSDTNTLASFQAAAPTSFTWANPTEFFFQARSSLTTLTFRDESSVTVSVDLLLDDVSVEPVPAPRIDVRCYQNLLVNGSFESPSLGPDLVEMRLPVGAPSLPGWEVGGTGDMFLVSQPWPDPPTFAKHGAQFMTFNGHDQREGQTTLFQTFQTVTGRWYTVRFSFGRGGVASGIVHLSTELKSDTSDTFDVFFALAPASFTWNPRNYGFMARSPLTTLIFRDISDATTSVDLLLDDVSVEQVDPRPSSGCTHVELCWRSPAAIRYQVQYRSDLTTDQWTDLGLPTQGAGIICVNDEIIPGQPQRFYRVVMLP